MANGDDDDDDVDDDDDDDAFYFVLLRIFTCVRDATVVRLDQLKKLFDERKLAWRKLRHERALAKFNGQVKDTLYVAPPERRAVFNEVCRLKFGVRVSTLLRH
jgi:hypothetical protein